MDSKQKKIYNRILDKYDLPFKNTFIQHRNLKEFRYFFIERVNPNHRILLYGKFKRTMLKDNHFPNKIIKVGEILLTSIFLLVPINNLFLDLEIKFITCLMLFSILFDLCFNNNIERFLNAYWNRRQYRVRKNSICS